MNKYTLISGGASGLGLDLSRLFAKDGHNLFLVSSNQKNLDAAKEEIEKEYNVEVKVLAVDLSNNQEFHKVKDFTDTNDMHIDNLVNCAGFGDRCDFKDMDIDKQIKMVELNCNCPLYLMRVYLDDMLKEENAHILNIASVASFFPGPYMCTYHSTKAFLLNVSEAIHRELKGTNVHLTTVCPGPFWSDFVKKAGNDYTFKKSKVLSSKEVAVLSMNAMKKNKMTYVIGSKFKMLIFFSRFATRKAIVNGSVNQIKGKE